MTGEITYLLSTMGRGDKFMSIIQNIDLVSETLAEGGFNPGELSTIDPNTGHPNSFVPPAPNKRYTFIVKLNPKGEEINLSEEENENENK